MARQLTKGTQIFVASVPQPTELTQPQFEALTWELVCCPNSSPAFGEEAEIVSEFCISGEEVTFVGAASGMETELSVFYDNECEGQDILREAFEGQPLAFKKEYSDGTATRTPTTIYTRALITTLPDGDGEVNDIVTHAYGLKLVQKPIFVKPEVL